MKVKVSMARLLTVVNERRKLRNEYRKHLEDQYISERKAEEKAQEKAQLDKLRAMGVKTPRTAEEEKAEYKRERERKQEELKQKYEELQAVVKKEEVAPLIEDRDLQLMATAKVKMTQTEILRMYVKNVAEMDLKTRRTVMGHINAQRAMHAKEVFLKELAGLGRKMKKQPKDEGSRVKNRKDPLKLKLEGITNSA